MTQDPVATNPDHYSVIFENDRVRVLEYRDVPSVRTTPHAHPDSVMVTLSEFSRRLYSGEKEMDVALGAGEARWLDAQTHAGHNIGATDTHVIFVELKEPAAEATAAREGSLGPSEA